MKISGSHTLAIQQEKAYQMMQDPVVLARAIPGCDALEKIADSEYRMKMKMVLAGLSGAFEGKVRIADQTPPSSFRLIVEGSGRPGFIKGDGLLKLAATPNSATEVNYDGDVQVGGTIAAVGQRLLDGTAKILIKKFFDNLAAAAARPAARTQAD